MEDLKYKVSSSPCGILMMLIHSFFLQSEHPIEAAFYQQTRVKRPQSEKEQLISAFR